LRAITKNQRSFDSAVIMSSVIPSEKYSCSGSSLMLTNGKHGDGGPAPLRQACSRLHVRLIQRRLTGVCRLTAAWLRAHGPDEAEALARYGTDQLLVLAAVANRLARSVDPAGQGRIRDNAAAPDRGYEVVLAHDPVAVLHQVDQQVEHLRLNGNRPGAAPQLAPVRVKCVAAKEKLHVDGPGRIEAGLKE
jgi:hypothetical protein